jgi:hypothetical protein
VSAAVFRSGHLNVRTSGSLMDLTYEHMFDRLVAMTEQVFGRVCGSSSQEVP